MVAATGAAQGMLVIPLNPSLQRHGWMVSYSSIVSAVQWITGGQEGLESIVMRGMLGTSFVSTNTCVEGVIWYSWRKWWVWLEWGR